MVFNPFKKKDDFVDLSAHFRKQQEREREKREEQKAENGDLKKNFYPNIGFNKSQESKSTPETVAPVFGIFNSDNNTTKEITPSENSFVGTSQDNSAEKRRKLAKRLIDMTTKMEDLSNQVYSLQQRIEVLERKSGIGY